MAKTTEGNIEDQELSNLPPPVNVITDMSISDDDIDPEQKALEEAEAAAKAEEEGGSGTDQVQAEPTPPPAAEPQAQPPANGQEDAAKSTEPGPVPYSRFRDVNETAKSLRGALTEAEQTAAYYKGQADTLAAMQQAGQPGQPAEQKPTGPDADIQSAKDAILKAAQDADDGVITQAKLEEIRFEQQEVIDDARQQKAAAEAQHAQQQRPAPQDPVPGQYSPGDQQVIDQQEKALVVDHPYMERYANDPAQRDRLIQLAYTDAKSEGKPIGHGAAGTMDLRQRFAKLSSALGPIEFPADNGANQQTATQQTGGTTETKPLSPEAQSRKDKNDLRGGHPPDSSTLGSGGTVKAEMTDADIEGMSELEVIEAMDKNPAAFRKFME